MVSLEQGGARWTYPALRTRPRQPSLLGALRDDGRPPARDVDVAARPALAGAADAPVRVVQPGQGARRRGRPLVGRSSGASSRPTSATARTSSSATARRRSRTAARCRTGGSPTTSSSRTTTRSSRTSAPPGRPGTSAGRSSPAATRSRRRAPAAYPNPPLEVTPLRREFRRGVRELGLHPFTQPSGITSRAWTDPYGNHRGGCLYCGFCTRFGCEVDAKASPLNTHLPVALNTGNTRCGPTQGPADRDRRRRPAHRRHVRRRARDEEHFQPADSSSSRRSRSRTTACSCSRGAKRIPTGSATTAAASARTTRTRSTRRRSPGSGRARS